MTLKSFLALSAVGALTALSFGSANALEPELVLKPESHLNQAMVELGKKLYFDPRLSASGVISCNFCHNLSMGGTDNIPTSVGHKWAQGPINAPTVLNAQHQVAQFWDGRAKDLAEQAKGPVENPLEMASSHALAVETIDSIPAYRAEFKTVFGDEAVNIDRIADAIAEFEKTLVTPGDRFDQYQLGDKTALTAQEIKGYELFKQFGCQSCHTGPRFGGENYTKMGMVEPYPTTNPKLGRFEETGKEEDKMVFKTPILRNIELTYPYFHDGAVWTLPEAVRLMAKHSIGMELTKEQTADVVAFLKALTGPQPKVELPVLPPSNEKTPKPTPFN